MGGPATPAGLIGHVSGTQCINWAWPFPSTGREPLAGLQMPGPSVLNIIVDGYLGRASADDRSWSSVDFDRAATDQSGGEGSSLPPLLCPPRDVSGFRLRATLFYQRNPFLHSFSLKFRRILNLCSNLLNISGMALVSSVFLFVEPTVEPSGRLAKGCFEMLPRCEFTSPSLRSRSRDRLSLAA